MPSLHTAFVIVGNGLPLIVGLITGLGAGDVLVLLYFEFFVGTLVNLRRVSVHRRLSRTRGHFEVVETESGLRALGLSFPPATGLTIFLFALYGFFTWGLLRMHELELHPDIGRYLLLATAPPIAEYVVQRPDLAGRPFSWIARQGQDTAGRLIAFGVMIPIGGAALMMGQVPGLVAMALAKGLVETLWGGLFGAIRAGRRTLPGFEGDPGIQREWRRAVAEHARITEHSEQVLDEATWHRLMQEAAEDFSPLPQTRQSDEVASAAATERRATPTPPRPEFTTGAASPETPGVPRRSGEPRRTFYVPVHRRRIIEVVDGDRPIAEITAPPGLERWTGTLEGRPVAMKVAAPWNRFLWQIQDGDTTVATAKQPRAFGLMRMPNSFRVSLSTGEFHWSLEERDSQLWRLTDTAGEVIHGELRAGALEDGRFELQVPRSLSVADALFLVWLREQAQAMTRR